MRKSAFVPPVAGMANDMLPSGMTTGRPPDAIARLAGGLVSGAAIGTADGDPASMVAGSCGGGFGADAARFMRVR